MPIAAENSRQLARGNCRGGDWSKVRDRKPRANRIFDIRRPPRDHFLAASESVGGFGRNLDFYFCAEFLHARQRAEDRGKVCAAVAGNGYGIEKGAVVVCGTDGFARNAGRRPAENFLAQTAQ